jgi:hypothetical protein
MAIIKTVDVVVGELDGPAVSVACERGRQATLVKISHQMGDQNLLSRAPPCFERTLSC